MILDRPITLPREVGGAAFPIETEDESFVFRAWFTRLNFEVRDHKVKVTGEVILRKYRQRQRSRFGRLLGRFFKRYRSETVDVELWELVLDHGHWNMLIGEHPSDIAEMLINVGLKKSILLHRSLLDEVLDYPTAKLREEHARVAPEILGKPREASANAA